MKYLPQIFAAIKNIKAHPKTTLVGAGLALLLALTQTANLHDALIQLGVLALGALAQDPLKKAS